MRNLRGVRGVANLVTVKPKARPEAIEAKIEEALKRSAELDARRIAIENRDGSVILRGGVDSYTEREEAEHAAWSAPGVTHVDNRLTVLS